MVTFDLFPPAATETKAHYCFYGLWRPIMSTFVVTPTVPIHAYINIYLENHLMPRDIVFTGSA